MLGLNFNINHADPSTSRDGKILRAGLQTSVEQQSPQVHSYALTNRHKNQRVFISQVALNSQMHGEGGSQSHGNAGPKLGLSTGWVPDLSLQRESNTLRQWRKLSVSGVNYCLLYIQYLPFRD